MHSHTAVGSNRNHIAKIGIETFSTCPQSSQAPKEDYLKQDGA